MIYIQWQNSALIYRSCPEDFISI